MNAFVTKIFTFDAAHQLVGHKGKCANLHGHTYKLEVNLYSNVIGKEDPSSEGFVIDFGDLKTIVNEYIVNPMDHSFLAAGNEPFLTEVKSSGSKVCVLGFRSTCENLAAYICFTLRKELADKIHSVKLWETPTAFAQIYSSDVDEKGPDYRIIGGCDFE